MRGFQKIYLGTSWNFDSDGGTNPTQQDRLHFTYAAGRMPNQYDK
jgi:hypothetical protein